MKRVLFIVLFAVMITSSVAQAQGSGQIAGTQCWINGKLVGGFPPGYTCPGTGGSSSGSSSSGAYAPLQQAVQQATTNFLTWLFSSDSNPQAELQKQQMMLELQRRQSEAERLHQAEEARRLAIMYNRLSTTLKMSGLPNLQLKETASNSPGLRLKLGDNADGQAGIKGLPGMYLNDGKEPYGIPGLPGIYTGGPRQGSGLTNSKLALKTGESDAGVAQVVSPAIGLNQSDQSSTALSGDTSTSSSPTLANESGLQLKTGDSNTTPLGQSTTLDPRKMTPQQLADVAEMVSKLPPEEQQRLMARAQNDTAAGAGQLVPDNTGQPSTQAPVPLQQQAAASQVAVTASVIEDSSAKARVGFDQPLGFTAVQIGAVNSTPSILRPPGTAVTANRLSAAPPPTTVPADSAPITKDWVKLHLFPDNQSAGPFRKNPNPPLTNPLREEQKLQAELKTWDDWAIQRATHIADRSGDKLYPASTELALLNTSTVKQYAPELLNRYNTDIAFRQIVDKRLQYTAEHIAFDYYQGLADAHKSAIRAFQAELEKLAAAGRLDRLVPLEDQYRLHPERRPMVQAVRDRIAADEKAAVEKAQADGSSKLDKEYQFVFQLIRGEAAQQR